MIWRPATAGRSDALFGALQSDTAAFLLAAPLAVLVYGLVFTTVFLLGALTMIGVMCNSIGGFRQ
jgi:hypothetical protein